MNNNHNFIQWTSTNKLVRI